MLPSLKEANFGGVTFNDLPISVSYFRLTLNLLLFFAVFLARWALWRSTPCAAISPTSVWVWFVGFSLVVILVLAFLELQPRLLDGMFSLAHNANSYSGG